MNIGAWQAGGMNIGAWQGDSASGGGSGSSLYWYIYSNSVLVE